MICWRRASTVAPSSMPKARTLSSMKKTRTTDFFAWCYRMESLPSREIGRGRKSTGGSGIYRVCYSRYPGEPCLAIRAAFLACVRAWHFLAPSIMEEILSKKIENFLQNFPTGHKIKQQVEEIRSTAPKKPDPKFPGCPCLTPEAAKDDVGFSFIEPLSSYAGNHFLTERWQEARCVFSEHPRPG